MCGLAGVMSSALSDGEVEAFNELMHVNVLRGWDGAGVAMIPQNIKKKFDIRRTLGTATRLVMDKDYNKLWRSGSFQAMIGHCRAPTKGAFTIENVHPHLHKNITLVHNGTLFEVCGKYLGGMKDKTRSDTSYLCEDIANGGIKNAIGRARGAYALVWYDSEAETINFLRNKERPLYFAWNDGPISTLYWSSEYHQLALVLGKRYGKLKVQPVPIDTVLTYKLPVTNGNIVADEEYECKPPEWGAWKGGRSYTGARNIDDEKEWWETTVQELDKMENAEGAQNVLPFVPLLPPPTTVAEPFHPPLAGTSSSASATTGSRSVPYIHRKDTVPRHLGRQTTTQNLVSRILGAQNAPDDIPEFLREEYIYSTHKPTVCLRKSDVIRMLNRGCINCSQKSEWVDFEKKSIKWVAIGDYACETCMGSPDAVETLKEIYPHAFFN